MLARVSLGALLSASVIVIAVAIAASFGVTWPGGKERSSSPQIKSLPDDAIAMPNLEPRDARRADHKKKKKAEHRRTLLMASDVRLLAPQGLVVSKAPVVPSTPVDEPVTLAPKPKPQPQRSPAKPAPATQPVAPAPPSTPLPAAPAGQAAAARATGLVRLSVRSVAVAPNAASRPELLVKMGIDGAHPDDAVPATVTMHLQPQVPATVPKDDPTLALTARLDMVEAPRTSPTDPALRMRVRMAITPAETGTPTVQEPGVGDGKSNVIALTVPLASFSGTPTDGTPPEQPGPGGPGPDPGPVDPAPEQPGSGGPGPNPGPPVDPAPEQPPVDPAPEQPPVDPAPEQPPVDPAPQQPAPVDPVPGQPTAGAPIPPIEILIPIGPVRPNTGSTTVPITPGTGDDAPATAPIPIDIVLEELPPDGPPPDSIPVDIVLEELPPYDPPADPAEVPTPATQEPPVDVPAPPADPSAGPAPDANQAAGDPALTASASAGDATSHDSGT